MKLYDFALAPNPRRVRMFLAEKGVEVPSVQVNTREREQFSGLDHPRLGVVEGFRVQVQGSGISVQCSVNESLFVPGGASFLVCTNGPKGHAP